MRLDGVSDGTHHTIRIEKLSHSTGNSVLLETLTKRCGTRIWILISGMGSGSPFSLFSNANILLVFNEELSIIYTSKVLH